MLLLRLPRKTIERLIGWFFLLRLMTQMLSCMGLSRNPFFMYSQTFWGD